MVAVKQGGGGEIRSKIEQASVLQHNRRADGGTKDVRPTVEHDQRSNSEREHYNTTGGPMAAR
jgi:hypothetical protein